MTDDRRPGVRNTREAIQAIEAAALRKAAHDASVWLGDNPSPYEGEGAVIRFLRIRADKLDGGSDD